MIINDVGGSFVPVLLVQTRIDPLTIESNTKMMMTCNFDLSLSYYNPVAGKIEPIIEKTKFLWSLASGEDSNPKFYMTLELNERKLQPHDEEFDVMVAKEREESRRNETKKKRAGVLTPLNINISDEMVARILILLIKGI